MILYDAKGQPHEIPEDQAAKALAGGQLFLKKGQELGVLNPRGEAVTIKAEDAQDALGRGFQVESAEQARVRRLKAEYGDDVGDHLIAGGLGALRGVTFGLSDVALEALGSPVAEYKEANEAASLLGEGIGIGGSLLIPGGQVAALAKGGKAAEAAVVAGKTAKATATATKAGKALEAARIATVAPRAVAKVGLAVENKTLALLAAKSSDGFLKAAVKKAASMGAGSAVEGAVYGTGQAISEAALGDLDLTAERVLAHAGTGALLGGAFGGMIGGGISVIGSGAGAGKKALVSLWEGATGKKAMPGLIDAARSKYIKAAALATGEEETVIARLLEKGEHGAIKRKIATGGDEIRNAASRDLAEAENELVRLFDDLSDEGRGLLKKDHVQKLTGQSKGIDNDTTASAVMLELDNLVSRLTHIGKKGPQHFGYLNEIAGKKGLIGRVQKAMGEMDDVINGEADAITEGFFLLDGLKRDIGKIRKKIGRRRDPGSADQAAIDQIEDIYQGLRSHLERPDLYGKAAEAQARVNAKWVKYLESNAYRERFHVKWKEKDWRAEYTTDPGAMRRFLDKLDDPSNDLDYQWLTQRMKARQELLEEMGDAFQLDPSSMARISEAKGMLDLFNTTMGAAEQSVVIQNQLRSLIKSGSETASLAGGLGGYAIAGLPGMVMGGAVGAISNPGRTIQRLAALERMASGTNGRIKSTVQKFLAPVKKAGKATKSTAVKYTPAAKRAIAPGFVILDGGDSPKDKREAYTRAVKAVQTATRDPQAQAARLSAATAPIAQAAPKLTQALQAKATRIAAHLADKAPDTKRRGLLAKDREPTPTEIDTFLKRVAVANDPIKALERATDGRLSLAEVQTLRECHPRIYAQIQQEITEQIPELAERLDYGKRVQLSILFQVPADPTMEADFIAWEQRQIGAGKSLGEDSEPAAPPAGSRPRTAKIEKARSIGAHMTRQDRLAMEA